MEFSSDLNFYRVYKFIIMYKFKKLFTVATKSKVKLFYHFNFLDDPPQFQK